MEKALQKWMLVLLESLFIFNASVNGQKVCEKTKKWGRVDCRLYPPPRMPLHGLSMCFQLLVALLTI
ncbi:MAG: hypothetical protein HXL36_06455 [Prevotellaceae bacterium]|nr:hypothetical protein [Prevotellaceae bacterium]